MEWNFGDGNTSTLENPTNTFANNGTYTVTLTEQNVQGVNATTETDYITVGGSGPSADFTATVMSGTVPLTVQFTDTSTGYPTSWLWNFGDGTTGSDQNPSHVYTSPGAYRPPSAYQTVSAAQRIRNRMRSRYLRMRLDLPIPIPKQQLKCLPQAYTYPTPGTTYQIPGTTPQASGTDSSAWVDQENQKMAALDMETPANASGLPVAIPDLDRGRGIVLQEKKAIIHLFDNRLA